METDDSATPRLLGLSVEEAVERVDVEDDPTRVRRGLQRVAEDGTVTPAAVESALGDAAKVVATPETRLEIAADSLDDAREDAAPVEDLGAVRSRLAAFERRLSTVERRLETLQKDLQSVVERAEDPADVYALAQSIEAVTDRANDLQRAADELAVDIEDFQRWLADSDRRYREFREDLDALERVTDELTTTEPADGADWLDASLRQRALGLLVADLRTELVDLRTWAEREDVPSPDPDGEKRLDALKDRLASVGRRLDDGADPSWQERFDDRIAGFEDAIADTEPPVPWSEIWKRYEQHSPGDPGE